MTEPTDNPVPSTPDPDAPSPTGPTASIAVEPVTPGPSAGSISAGSESRRLRRIATASAFAISVLLAFAIGVGAGRSGPPAGNPIASTGLPPGGDAENFALLQEAYKLLKDNYVQQKDLDLTKLTYGAIDGMLEAVGDTGHTRFLTPDELKAQHSGLSGSIEGIGALMAEKDGLPVIQSVITGGPAEKAGLRGGDRILEIDGTTTAGMSLDDVVAKVRGPAGSTVTLKISRDGTGGAIPSSFSIVRAKVTVPSTTWAFFPGTKIAVVRLEQFSTGSGDEVVAALKDAKAGGATSIILDLRENPGGYVNQAVKVASQFLSGGDVYISQDGKGTRTPSSVEKGGVATDLPLTVLVNAGSASSSEIVAGALLDAGRGEVIGAKTFGTGTVLGEYPLSDGSAMLIGTIEWLTPKGNEIWHKGITPTVPVDMPSDGRLIGPSEFDNLGVDGITAAKDAQLLKAIELLSK